MENTFQQLLDNSKSILIVLPKNPYFDQVAAGLGLYLGLKDKKDVSITSSTPMVVEFNRLVGVNKIAGEVGNKNLVIKFSNYQADSIERVSYDIEGSEFKLSVIPKPQVTPPREDQIMVSYSGLSVDTVILIGGANESHFPQLSQKEFAGAKIAHIGIQNLTSDNLNIASYSRSSSSVSEIVADILYSANIELNQDIASNLLAGLYEGTKNFGSNHVTENTFRVAADLKAVGADHSTKDKVESKDFPAGAIPAQIPEVAKPAPEIAAPAPQTQSQPEQPEQEPQPQPEQAPQPAPEAVPPAIAQPKPIATTTPPKSWLEPKILKSGPTN